MPPSPSLSALNDAIAGRPRLSESEAGWETPRVAGYAFVDAEPTPAEVRAFETGAAGKLDTAAILSGLAAASGARGGGAPFSIREEGGRDALHRRLLERGKGAGRGKGGGRGGGHARAREDPAGRRGRVADAGGADAVRPRQERRARPGARRDARREEGEGRPAAGADAEAGAAQDGRLSRSAVRVGFYTCLRSRWTVMTPAGVAGIEIYSCAKPR